MPDLAEIRRRDADYLRGLRDTGYDFVSHPSDECEADKDRYVLLAELDRLSALLHAMEETLLYERARILAAVAGLPHGEYVEWADGRVWDPVNYPDVIAAIEREVTA